MSLAKPSTPRSAPTRRRVTASFALASAAHLLGLGLLVALDAFFPRPPTPRKPPARPVSLRTVDSRTWQANRGRFLPQSAEPPAPLHPRGQVVDVAPGNHLLAPDAKYLAETDNRVKKETRAREQTSKYSVATARNTPAPETMPAVQGTNRSPAPEAASASSRLEGFLGGGRLHPRLSDLMREATTERDSKGLASASEETNGSDASEAAVGGGAPNDDLQSAEAGDATVLNTREWRYASFFNRVKQAVAGKWDPNGRVRERNLSVGVQDRATLLHVALRPDGSLADVFVATGSGVDSLDREAVAAFERAAPFPNPPAALVEHGVIAFAFRFTLMNQGPNLGWMPTVQRR